MKEIKRSGVGNSRRGDKISSVPHLNTSAPVKLTPNGQKGWKVEIGTFENDSHPNRNASSVSDIDAAIAFDRESNEDKDLVQNLGKGISRSDERILGETKQKKYYAAFAELGLNVDELEIQEAVTGNSEKFLTDPFLCGSVGRLNKAITKQVSNLIEKDAELIAIEEKFESAKSRLREQIQTEELSKEKIEELDAEIYKKFSDEKEDHKKRWDSVMAHSSRELKEAVKEFKAAVAIYVQQQKDPDKAREDRKKESEAAQTQSGAQQAIERAAIKREENERQDRQLDEKRRLEQRAKIAERINSSIIKIVILLQKEVRKQQHKQESRFKAKKVEWIKLIWRRAEANGEARSHYWRNRTP